MTPQQFRELDSVLSESLASEYECKEVADWLSGPVIAEDPDAASAARDYAVARVRFQRERGESIAAMRKLVYVRAAKRVLDMRAAGRLRHATPEDVGALRAALIAGGASPEKTESVLQAWGLARDGY